MPNMPVPKPHRRLSPITKGELEYAIRSFIEEPSRETLLCILTHGHLMWRGGLGMCNDDVFAVIDSVYDEEGNYLPYSGV